METLYSIPNYLIKRNFDLALIVAGYPAIAIMEYIWGV
jgi:hypothetical protein